MLDGAVRLFYARLGEVMLCYVRLGLDRFG